MGSRVAARLLLAAAFWAAILIPIAWVWLNASAFLVLAFWSGSQIVRRLGWWSFVIPLVRPAPFLGLGLWIYFAPPRRRDAPIEWIAWVAVFSWFFYPLLAG